MIDSLEHYYANHDDEGNSRVQLTADEPLHEDEFDPFDDLDDLDGFDDDEDDVVDYGPTDKELEE